MRWVIMGHMGHTNIEEMSHDVKHNSQAKIIGDSLVGICFGIKNMELL